MLGILVQLVVSWVLLRFVEKKNLEALGLIPTPLRMRDLSLGFLITGLFVVAFNLTSSALSYNPFKVNPGFTVSQFFITSGYIIQSVVFEELIFRGAILYILIQRIGSKKAILISSAGFGIYHWFSYGLFGQPIPMTVIFVSTGLVGWVLATAFYRSGSMYLPFALHLGFNFVSMLIFSSASNIGPQWFVKTFDQDQMSMAPLLKTSFTLIYYLGFPGISYLAVVYLSRAHKAAGVNV